MSKQTIHVSDVEAASNLSSLLDHVSAGDEVVIERDSRPVAVVRSPDGPRGRLLSESIALAQAHARDSGCEPVLDADCAADLEEIIASRKPRDLTAWDSVSTRVLVETIRPRSEPRPSRREVVRLNLRLAGQF
jgi:antitoxin (DNA-binding transcriptional repressor) of toxin-antitoxin stability system